MLKTSPKRTNPRKKQLEIARRQVRLPRILQNMRMSHLVLPVQVQIPKRTKSDRHNKIPRYVSNSFKFLFYHLIKSILVEEADTKEEVEIEVGTTIMEVDIEVDMMEDMDVVGTADEVAVDTADMEIIVVGHIAGITGLDRKFTTKLVTLLQA